MKVVGRIEGGEIIELDTTKRYVISVDGRLTADQAATLKEQWLKHFPNIPVVILNDIQATISEVSA